MPETVRFAPSPTGEIHIGNVRTALYNWFLAMESGGRFLLRFDDTDVERSREAFVTAITEDLAWLGIRPHQVERQSARLAAYDAAADALRAKGLLYPCYETPDELERKRARQRARGLPPVYDRAALALDADARAALEAEGRRPHWRFKLPAGARSWEDRCRGPQTVNLETISDPVLVREDGTYLYTICSVVDDIDHGVTTIVRGEDHITNTGVQIAIFEGLGATPPAFGHHNLLTRSDGEPLSKRDNPLSVTRLRAEGYEPMAIASLAALVGTSHAVEPIAEMGRLAAMAPLASVSRGPAMFDPADLVRLNAALLHGAPFEAMAPWLAAEYGADDPVFWETVRGNLTFRHDVAPWVEIWRKPPALVGADGVPLLDAGERAVVAAAADALPAEPWGEETFKAWTGAVRAATGAKGKALFMPLRKALTGREAGPEMAAFMLLLGREAVLHRLQAAARPVGGAA
ncbi:glutamate--tRNA ligase [Acuticoccus kandeliae]|uniref:glutamate--tRNA ligase n=1 Tax=Acuticoccus kandeliae TaxID=2073160 RepID=UPI000D3EB09E|nr:glutamate--tRNA ligase [Acuticoccus kandeliae]